MNALPSRLAPAGFKAELERAQSGAEAWKEIAQKYARITESWRANPWKPMTRSCIGKR